MLQTEHQHWKFDYSNFWPSGCFILVTYDLHVPHIVTVILSFLPSHCCYEWKFYQA